MKFTPIYIGCQEYPSSTGASSGARNPASGELVAQAGAAKAMVAGSMMGSGQARPATERAIVQKEVGR